MTFPSTSWHLAAWSDTGAWLVPPRRAACPPPRCPGWHWGAMRLGEGQTPLAIGLATGWFLLVGSEEGVSSSTGVHHHVWGRVPPLGTVTLPRLQAGHPQSVGNQGPGRGNLPKYLPKTWLWGVAGRDAVWWVSQPRRQCQGRIRTGG